MHFARFVKTLTNNKIPHNIVKNYFHSFSINVISRDILEKCYIILKKTYAKLIVYNN